ncbi:RsmB/NOP family class I SAM-dependent RNA methyltransferase [Nocardia heshunensis]
MSSGGRNDDRGAAGSRGDAGSGGQRSAGARGGAGNRASDRTGAGNRSSDRGGAGKRSSDQVGARGDSRSKAAGEAREDNGAAAARRAEKAGADPVRIVARDVLRAVRERDAYANLVLPGLLRERKISGRDAALATELAYGASRSLGLLDAVIADCAGRSVEEIDGPLLDALRLGTYQLLRTRIGAHAAVDTSVALARVEYGQGRAGFVNAVLRRVAERTPEEWVERLAPSDPLGHLAFEYAHPVWIAQAFADALGARAGELREVLEADDARPAVHLVARPGEITAEELALITGGEEGRWSPYAVYLDGGDPGKLEPVREGMAAVQDEGSQLVALAVTKAPLQGPDNGRWLDLCAGPGGKTALLAAIADIDGFRVDAVEPAEHRAELVRQTTRGMPVDIHVADGRDSGLEPGFDRILVDAPCTGLGALRRRPEARWRRQPSDVRELVALQRELLTAAWDLVRPGGVVIYSTCSPHLPETVSVVSDVVRRTGAEQLDTRELLPGVPELGDGPGAQLWPHRHGTDAMFLAALRKPLAAD